MQTPKRVVLFDEHPVRRSWDEKQEKWYFSVVDVVRILTASPDSGAYWRKLKQRLVEEGSEVVTFCHGLKLEAADGKKYETDCADIEGLFRIIQSVPSPKAEPFKRWLAKTGYERMQETIDPEKTVTRARKTWQAMGRSQKWINQRMLSIENRNKLTDYWGDHGVEKPDEYARLTNVIHQEWSGITVKEHKNLKGLGQENLRDHMSDAELIFTSLAELSARQISEATKAEGYKPNEVAAKRGGKISGNARAELEAQTGKKVITNKNLLN